MPERTGCAVGGALVVAVVLGLGATACSSGADPVPTDWWVDEAVADDATTVEISLYVGSTSCTTFEGIRVTGGEDEVRIDARVTEDDGGGECTTDLAVLTREVELDGPLGDRRLVGCVAGRQIGTPRPTDDDCRQPFDPFAAP